MFVFVYKKLQFICFVFCIIFHFLWYCVYTTLWIGKNIKFILVKWWSSQCYSPSKFGDGRLRCEFVRSSSKNFCFLLRFCDVREVMIDFSSVCLRYNTWHSAVIVLWVCFIVIVLEYSISIQYVVLIVYRFLVRN